MTQLNEQARTVNAFGTRLLSLLDRGDASSSSSNLFLSPPSIVAALSLALAAAEPGSECEKQLREALAPSSCASAEEALASVAALLSSAVAASSTSSSSSPSSSSPAPSPIVEAANSVWCAGGYEFSEDYLSRLEPFKAEARSLSEGGAKAINSWVSAKTRGKISAIVDETTAAAATAILVNALYFKGQWRQKFDPRASGPGDFEVSKEEKKKIKAHFMNKTFKRGSGAKVFKKAGAVSLAVKLPYASSSSSSSSTDDGDAGGGESGGERDLFEAVFALPEPGVPFADALAALQEEEKREGEEGGGGEVGGGEGGEGKWTDPPRAGVEVSVPAFKAEGACLRLAPLLRAPPPSSSSSSSSPCSSGGLGLSAPFCQATCEFTRMFAGGREAPAIEEVLHKVTVECDEQGSEAAAATAVVMMRAMLAVEEPLRFSADRPFLFCVRHVASGLDLFAGRVAVPRSWEGKEGDGKADGGDGEPGCRPGAAPVCD